MTSTLVRPDPLSSPQSSSSASLIRSAAVEPSGSKPASMSSGIMTSSFIAFGQTPEFCDETSFAGREAVGAVASEPVATALTFPTVPIAEATTSELALICTCCCCCWGCGCFSCCCCCCCCCCCSRCACSRSCSTLSRLLGLGFDSRSNESNNPAFVSHSPISVAIPVAQSSTMLRATAFLVASATWSRLLFCATIRPRCAVPDVGRAVRRESFLLGVADRIMRSSVARDVFAPPTNLHARALRSTTTRLNAGLAGYALWPMT